MASIEENVRIVPGDIARGEIEVVSERVAWENEVARVLEGRLRFPSRDGAPPVEKTEFRLGLAPGIADGVVVAPILPDDRILLVRQFRHPVRMWLRELPRGARRVDESPETAVARELREETGCAVRALYPLGRLANDSGQLAGVPHLFAATVSESGAGTPEDTEVIDRTFRYAYTELVDACRRGEILDAFTLAVTLRLAPHFNGDRFAWKAEAAPTARVVA